MPEVFEQLEVEFGGHDGTRLAFGTRYARSQELVRSARTCRGGTIPCAGCTVTVYVIFKWSHMERNSHRSLCRLFRANCYTRFRSNVWVLGKGIKYAYPSEGLELLDILEESNLNETLVRVGSSSMRL